MYVKGMKISTSQGMLIIVLLIVGLSFLFFLFSPVPTLTLETKVVKNNDIYYFILSSSNSGSPLKNLDLSLSSLDLKLLDMMKCETNIYNFTYSGCQLEHMSAHQIFLSCPKFPIKAMIHVKCEMNDNHTDVVLAVDSDLMIMQKNYINCNEKECPENISIIFINYPEIFKRTIIPFNPS